MIRLILSSLKLSVILAMAVLASSGAQANIVLNGNFSTGSFTNWSLTGDSSLAYVTPDGQGNYVAALSTLTTQGYLSQTLTTTNGQLYSYSFILASDNATPNSFTASLGGAQLVSLTNVTSTSSTTYTTYSGSYTATSASSVLQFSFTDTTGYLYLTNISVNPTTSVPEPASIIGLGLGAVVLLRQSGRRGRSRQEMKTSAPLGR